ncbi:putative atp-dependent rna helicase suv3 [Phaeomoniella chlamydospora]|uniref:RNA helicase n=1 Tax=Phaeomoniella chlamydospora TaxID=158046 RepID=A0A0G2DRS4_PHACM|nr:putative atp-dependent rna helicase suv3 [Phaeomoniella chlamydospora]
MQCAPHLNANEDPELRKDSLKSNLPQDEDVASVHRGKHSTLLADVGNALNNIKSKCKTEDFANNRMLKQVSLLDPDKQHLKAFSRRVLGSFRNTADKGTERPLEENIIKACKEGSKLKRPWHIMSALIDGYAHHIMVDRGYGNDDRHSLLLDSVKYPTEFFPNARKIQRHIHLHVGPTNSGKTYNALKRLEKAETGFYAGPLRLLAHEIYTRLNAAGVQCGLVTGDEIRGMEAKPKITSHTVEMVPLHKEYDVGVIDEIQMLAHEDRGWAWTQALLGARARELHLCGEERTVPLIQELVATMGDTLHIHRYERLNVLKPMSTSLKGNLKKLRKGDCVVCFSIIKLHSMKKEIEEATGRNCAIVYGSLPSELRAQQARLFNDPDNTYDFLVASDAIGMGLNLSIKRVIFETVYKFNGTTMDVIDIPSLKQIAGRAGRYKSAQEVISKVGSPIKQPDLHIEGSRTIGLVTSLHDSDLAFVRQALKRDPEPLTRAGLRPPGEVVAQYALAFPPGTPYTYILNRLYQALSFQSRYFLCHPNDEMDHARNLEGIDLSPSTKFVLTAAPAAMRDGSIKLIYQELAMCIATQQKGHLLDLITMPLETLEQPPTGDRKLLDDLVVLHKGLTLYIWLAFRFADILESRVLAEHTKILVERNMDEVLKLLSLDPKIRETFGKRQKSVDGQRLHSVRSKVTDLKRSFDSFGNDEEVEVDETPSQPPDRKVRFFRGKRESSKLSQSLAKSSMCNTNS